MSLSKSGLTEGGSKKKRFESKGFDKIKGLKQVKIELKEPVKTYHSDKVKLNREIDIMF